MFELGKNHKCHNRDLRSLDFSRKFLITGGSDKKINLFTYKNGQLHLQVSSDAIQKNVLCVKINPFESAQGLFAIAGFVDGQIVGYDIHCTPIWMIEHNSNVNSLCFINSDHFVSGSWDGHAIVWNITTKKKVSELTEHKYAVSVFYNPITDLIVSGSQDKAINLWSWKDGKKVKRIENAHSNIIREISPVDEVGFITCSNDETLKLWSSDLQEIQTFTGHTTFVFAVKSIGFGHYISGGQDRSIKIWRDDSCEQTIQLPASVWTLAYDSETGDIFSGCSDGYLRVFTKDPSRRASQQQLQVFNKEVLQSAAKKSGMSEDDIKKLPLTSQMKNYNGKKEGEIRVFRDGLNPEAYMWQGGQWIKIGDVITENPNQGAGGSNGGSKYYPGDAYFQAGEYDHIFDVQDDSGVRKLIPYNDGGNPLDAAERYCSREGLSKGYIEQIRKFLMANSSKIPRSALKQQPTKVDLKELRSTPCTTPIQFNDIKDPSALMKKIKEFNENAEGEKLNEREMNHIERIATQLQNSATYYNVKFDGFEIDSLKKLLKWRKDLKVPVWDLLRAFLKHYQSEALFSGLSAGNDVISQLCMGLQSENKQAIYTLILRTLSNILIHNTNKNGMLKYYELVLGSIRSITKSSPGLSSANFTYAMSAFLYNYSIATIEKNLEKEEDTIKMYAETVKERLKVEKEDENITLLFQGVSNILYKHHAKYGGEFAWAKNMLEKCNNKDLSLDVQMLVG